MTSTRINLAPPDAVPEETQRLRVELEACEDRALRLRADFDNYRRRTARERDAATSEGRRKALLAILPALDGLEHALAAGSSDDVFFEGVVTTHTLFLKALRELGAEPIESVGRLFDPNLHEGVATLAADDVPAGTVVRELRRGWRLGTELVRPAQVVVTIAP